MTTSLACMLCTLGQGTDLLLPMAQATVIVAPIFLRDQIKRGARAVRGRRVDPSGANDLPNEDELEAGEAADQD